MHDPGCAAKGNADNACNCRYSILNKNHHDFIRLWTDATRSEIYNKKEWRGIEEQLVSSGAICLTNHYDVKVHARDWLLNNDIDFSSACGKTFDELSMVNNHQAFLYVGAGVKGNGERVGFALEVGIGSGVIVGKIMRSVNVEDVLHYYTDEAASTIKTMMEVFHNENISFDSIQELFGLR